MERLEALWRHFLRAVSLPLLQLLEEREQTCVTPKESPAAWQTLDYCYHFTRDREEERRSTVMRCPLMIVMCFMALLPFPPKKMFESAGFWRSSSGSSLCWGPS